MENKIPNGLKKLPKDDRDFKLGAIFDLPPLSDLPENFVVGLPTVKDQKDTDFCAAFSSCTISELQEEVELCPEWSFAVGKMIENDVESFGLDIRTICQAHTKYGAIEVKDAPYSLEKGQTSDFLRRIENWPEDLFGKATAHKKGSYFSVEAADTDRFDTIRRTMYKFQNEKCGVIFGVMWSWALAQTYILESGTGSGHALAQIGWERVGEESGLIDRPFPIMMYIQNSYTTAAGKGGRHYFSREVINAFVDDFGAFMFHPLSKDTVQHMIDHGIKASDNWLQQLWKIITTIFLRKKNVFLVTLTNILGF